MLCATAVNTFNTYIKLNYRKANLDKIKNTLSSTDWDRLLEGEIETAWNNFKNLILSQVDANVPKMKIWGTKKLKPVGQLINVYDYYIYIYIDKKRKTFVKYKEKDHPACVKANKLALREIRKARKDFERKLATDIKFDKKSFFLHMRKVRLNLQYQLAH